MVCYPAWRIDFCGHITGHLLVATRLPYINIHESQCLEFLNLATERAPVYPTHLSMIFATIWDQRDLVSLIANSIGEQQVVNVN